MEQGDKNLPKIPFGQCAAVILFFFNFVMLLQWRSYISTFSQSFLYSKYESRKY